MMSYHRHMFLKNMGVETNKNYKSEIIHKDEKPIGNQQEAKEEDNNTMISAGSTKGEEANLLQQQGDNNNKQNMRHIENFENEGIYTIDDREYDSEEDSEDDLPLDRSLEKCEQRRLKRFSAAFRHECYYGGPYDDKKFCIWSGGDPFSWSEKSSGIPWIGINGTDAACVVALKEKPLPPSGRTRQMNSTLQLYTALCDIGVLADTSTASTEFRRLMIAQSSSKNVGPFAVVSAPCTAAVDHLGSSHGASPAVEFLVKKLKGRSAITHFEIRQIAVCALKFLLGPKFDPNMIDVMRSGKKDHSKFGASEIQELLSAMNQT